MDDRIAARQGGGRPAAVEHVDDAGVVIGAGDAIDGHHRVVRRGRDHEAAQQTGGAGDGDLHRV